MAKGTAKYIVGKVERFDQKNEMWRRPRWDPSQREIGRKVYGTSFTHLREDQPGYTQIDLALATGGWHVETGFAHGNVTENTGLYQWDMDLLLPYGGAKQPIPDEPYPVPDPSYMSQIIKKAAQFFGASRAGICELNKLWVYSHSFHFWTKEHVPLEIPEEYKYAVAMIIEMDYDAIETSPTWLTHAACGLGYSRMAFTASSLAQFIRTLGYKAIPSGNDTALSIPIAIDAGLGELGRNGLLITPEFGPRVRICKVLTNLPLVPDEPIEFGVTEFCNKCGRCAESCPGQAILYGDMIDKPRNISNAVGQLKWPIDAEKCFKGQFAGDTTCMNCERVCPFNKTSGWLHSTVRWGVKNTPWLDPLFVRMDKLLGYGKQKRAEDFWLK